MTAATALPLHYLENTTAFQSRHIGPSATEEQEMLRIIGAPSRQALINAVMPAAIKRSTSMQLPEATTEVEALAEMQAIARQNKVMRSHIGQGYYDCHTPTVIQRNILENPAWYTAYTPYQAEISQGRMEALVNFQTMVCDLTGMDIANASMLDEATAAAEAITLARRSLKTPSQVVLLDQNCHPQVIEVIRTRCEPIGLEVITGTPAHLIETHECFVVVASYPGTDGSITPLQSLARQVHERKAALIVTTDLLALTLLTPPGEQGADIVVGNTQRFGVPMGAGGPHAAFLACRDEFKRSMPGRLVGVSIDATGQKAYRLALQTREQHIRREKATSNICTAQVLLAVMASMYAVYHGPQGLTQIANRVARYTSILAQGLRTMGWRVLNAAAFDTLSIDTGSQTQSIIARAEAAGANLRLLTPTSIGISLDETTTREHIQDIWGWLGSAQANSDLPDWSRVEATAPMLPDALLRKSPFLTHSVFNTHRSETQMLRYIRSLSDKDLALDRTMIPLGSCTMKLNATSEMIPITWPEFARIHPFAPAHQLQGYQQLNADLQNWLSQATGYAGISLQPNAGSQGEYAGLLAIRAWQAARGQSHRNICLIPESAHGTNPASAQMVGMQVVAVKCDDHGNVDMQDLRIQCEKHGPHLAAAMITYPSTYGVFDPNVRELCALIKQYGGRVYIDGANMNALVGLAAPGEFGGDVSHLNLHKTFCIPHGGGGPGVGPVCVVSDLVPYLPGHTAATGEKSPVGAVSAAALGNAAVLPISWMYIRMMGAQGLEQATEMAIVNANYVAARLANHYSIHYSSDVSSIQGGGVAHECILDLRPLKETSGVTAEDVAKRLIDYGFHAPTLSFPVAGTLMVEPTESESKDELDRFCDAMIAIRQEIALIEQGQWPQDDNPLKNAPHTALAVTATSWAHPYTREEAAYPIESLQHPKYWSPVSRVDNVWGDRNLFCSCSP